MITGKDFYTVMTAVVPLYVAMILAYGSVRWWRIFTSDQCSGINRFVAIFAVPLLSFHFIAANNPYTMNLRFIAADTLQKIIMLAALAGWANISRRGNLDWSITIFSLSTLPNTLVMGIPLLIAMYGNAVDSGSLMVQIVVLQCVIWYTLLLFLFEYRAAKILITDQFPDTAASIVSFKVESDVVSLDGGEFLETDAELGRDGKLHVTVRKSTSSRRSICGGGSGGCGYSVSGMTPRPSNLTGAEIYSLSSSRNPTPRGSTCNGTDFFAMMAAPGGPPRRYSSVGQAELYSLQTSRGPTPRSSSFEEPRPAPASAAATAGSPGFGFYSVAGAPYQAPNPDVAGGGGKSGKAAPGKAGSGNHDAKELHMFVWSSSASPVSDAGGLHVFGGNDQSGRSDGVKEIGMLVADHPDGDAAAAAVHHLLPKDTKIEPFPHPTTSPTSKAPSFPAETYNSGHEISPSPAKLGGTAGLVCRKQMPPASVMTRLILIMVWRKLIRNPNTYSSLIGLIWALVSYRWHISMPKIIAQSISILSDAGLGMAMFSLGLFMALQPKIIACGNSVATFAMAIRFLTGPAVMAAASIAVGLRGVLLHVAIVQAALPQGIVPFVFAKEYNVHPAILSTGVIFGMLIALPITLVYYILLDL